MSGFDGKMTYKEIVRLGSGRDVWLVLESETNKVFIKKCRKDFKQEVYENISRIQSPHIPRICHCQQKEGTLYIIEEYIAGETLLEKMEHGYVFSEKETMEIMVQLCEALECLHIRFTPIIHRDIKPSNIMLSNDGILKLIDYNAARCYEKGATKDTEHMGTQGYAAPEQYGFSQTDVRTDIYAMGVVMNYMLVGRPPGEETASGALGKIIRKCIQMDPDKRYDSVGSVKLELERLLGRREEEAYPSLWLLPGFCRRKKWKKLVTALGYCLMVLGVWKIIELGQVWGYWR